MISDLGPMPKIQNSEIIEILKHVIELKYENVALQTVEIMFKWYWSFNLLMASGNKKVTHTLTNLPPKAAGLFKYE